MRELRKGDRIIVDSELFGNYIGLKGVIISKINNVLWQVKLEKYTDLKSFLPYELKLMKDNSLCIKKFYKSLDNV